MTFRVILLFPTLLFTIASIGQTHIITGKIIDEQLQLIYQARIFTADTVLLATSDTNGSFNVDVPSGIKSLLIGSIGMEWKNIGLANDCGNLEIILLPSGTYDFMSAAKVGRLRKKQFDKLQTLHHSAFEKSIFKTEKPCYTDKFIPIKKQLKEIHKSRTQTPGT